MKTSTKTKVKKLHKTPNKINAPLSLEAPKLPKVKRLKRPKKSFI